MKNISRMVNEIKMLNDETSYKVMDYYFRYNIWDHGIVMNRDDFGPDGLILPYAPVKTVRFWLGRADAGTYNHEAQLAKFKGNYYFAWANGKDEECKPGTRILVSTSSDAWRWSDPAVITIGDIQADEYLECVGIRATEETLYVWVDSDPMIYDANSKGGKYKQDWDKKVLKVFATINGSDWEHVHTYSAPICKLFEAPRDLKNGGMLCVCSMKDRTPAILRWDDTNLLREPEIVPVPYLENGGHVGNGEGSWYQTKEGRIITFWREDGGSCRLWISYSDDGGETFSELTRSDIPDSVSRVYAGVLADGRRYLVGNAYPQYGNRRHLLLLLSDDGLVFNAAHVIVSDLTTKWRHRGTLKNYGFQYPCCVAEKDRLIIGYSVNKEDMECATVGLDLLGKPS